MLASRQGSPARPAAGPPPISRVIEELAREALDGVVSDVSATTRLDAFDGDFRVLAQLRYQPPHAGRRVTDLVTVLIRPHVHLLCPLDSSGPLASEQGKSTVLP